ncbi:extracellular solute-binding protein [Paenibacillus sp. MBLB4367]|uniref:extracellular solute-binding protein n=1 Tax=Paenibacillus sp. MBLB4367 TaxID=3384767 RepID=UPI00390819FC
MKGKYKAIGLSMMAVSLAFVSACSSNTETPASSPKKEEPAAGVSSAQPKATEKADPFGKYAQPVTMTIGKGVPADDKTLPAGDTVENNQFTRYFEEKLNLKFKAAWVAALGDAFDQKLALSISSNDLPDAMVVSEKELKAMVKAGQLEDLSKVYEQYASPNLKKMYDATKGKAFESATFNGKLMALPNLNVDEDPIRLMWVRQDWLDKLGLKPPQTVDELAAIAKAFIEKDPDGNGKADTFGLLGDSGNTFGPLYSAYQAYPGKWLKDKDGKVFYGTTAPEMKQALAKLRAWYEQGMLDKEYAIRKDTAELVNGGRAGLFLYAGWSMPWGLYDSVKNNPKAVWKAYALPLDSSGKYNATVGPVSSQYFVVKKGYRNPEAVVKYLNLYSNIENDAEATSKLINGVNAAYYPLRATFVEPQIVTNRLKAVKKALDGQLKPDQLRIDEKDIYDKVVKNNADPGKDPGSWMYTNAYLVGGGALESPMNKVASVFNSQTKAMELKWPALKKMEDEMITKIIMGKESLDSFDAFVTEWKKSGGEQIIKEIEEELKK